jgi:hypothetical protein
LQLNVQKLHALADSEEEDDFHKDTFLPTKKNIRILHRLVNSMKAAA